MYCYNIWYWWTIFIVMVHIEYSVNLTYFILKNCSCFKLVSKNEISYYLFYKQIDNLQICFLNSYDKYYFWMKHIVVNFKWSRDDNTDTLWKEDKISAFYFSLEDSIFFSEQVIARFDKRLQKKCIFTLIY